MQAYHHILGKYENIEKYLMAKGVDKRILDSVKEKLKS